MRVRVIQGANMNLLGRRDPALYGRMTAEELDAMIRAHAARRGVEVDIRYTNSEAECIDLIQEALLKEWDGLIMNPGGFTRHSPVIGETLHATGIPYVEVHMKNLEAHGGHSVLAKQAIGVVMGFRERGYLYALDALCDWLEERARP
jgi:3-dehydroquinate dehydratase-2